MKSYSVYRQLKSLVKSVMNGHTRTVYSIVQPREVSPKVALPDHIVKPLYAITGEILNVETPEIKTAKQIEGVRKACKLARTVLNTTANSLKVGMTTDAIDQIVNRECVANGAYPSPLVYKGFPKSVCTSVNNVACHGIPDNRPLVDGDIINVDITVFYNGFHGDVSETYLIGEVDTEGRKLVEVARQCLDVGVSACGPGARMCNIGNAISEFANGMGYSVIPHACGHGIGEYFHGPPCIRHFAYEDKETMVPGMTFTIEPIITDGDEDVELLDDGWTVVSVDNSRSAQFEHTVLITENGVDVLTA